MILKDINLEMHEEPKNDLALLIHETHLFK